MFGYRNFFKKYAGFIPVLILFLFMLLNEGLRITTGPGDIFIPLYPANQNLYFYLNPFKFANFGGLSNAPIGYAIFYFFNTIFFNTALAQHVIQLLPLLISYFSFWLLLGQIEKKNSFYRQIFSVMYVFNAVGLNQFTGATGLMYMYAFFPLLFYFILRYYNNGISFTNAFIGSVFAIYFSTFSSTETILHIIITIIPILLMLLINIKLDRKILKNTGKTFLLIFGAIAVSMICLSFTYYPWIEGTLGISTPISSNLVIAGKTFLDHNFYAQNPDFQVFTYIFSPIFSFSYIYRPTIYELIIAFFSAILFISSIHPRKITKLSLAAMIFIIVSTLYLGFINYFPSKAFQIFLIMKPISIPLVGLPLAQEWWYVLIPWEIILLYIGAINLDEFIKSISLACKKLKNKLKLKNNGKKSMNYVKASKIIVVIIVSLILLNVLYAQIPGDINSTDANIKLQNIHYFGNVENTNHIPKYFEQLQNNFIKEQIKTPFRVLYFPNAPANYKWTYTDPYSISFPSGNTVINSEIFSVLNDTVSGNVNKSASILSELGIKYVIILWKFNENLSNPYMINQGLIGNPKMIFDGLSSSNDFSLIVNNTDYAVFLNNEFSFINYYPASYTLPVDTSMGSNLTYFSPEFENNTNIKIINNINIFNFKDHGKVQWSSFNPGNISVSGNESSGNITLNSNKEIQFALTYSLNNNIINYLPVMPGQEYSLSFTAITNNNTSGVLQIGWNNRTLNYRYIGDQNLPTIPLQNNTIYNYSINATIGNIYYIIPFIAVYGFHGNVTIKNLKLNLINEGVKYNNSLLTYKQNKDNMSYIDSYNIISEIYPFTNFASLSNNNIENTIHLYYPYMNYSYNSTFGIVVPLKYYSNVTFGIVKYNYGYTTMHSLAEINGDIPLKNGNYIASIYFPSDGLLQNGVLNLTLNNNYKIVNSSVNNVNVEFKVSNGKLIYNFTNYLGDASIGPIIIYSVSSYNSIYALINTTGEMNTKNNFNITNNGNSMIIHGNLTSAGIITISTIFEKTEDVIVYRNGIKCNNIGIFQVNGWQTGIYLKNGTYVIYINYHVNSLYYITLYLQSAALILLPLLLLFFYVMDYFKKGKLKKKNKAGEY